jgi:hypothetical protein
MQAASVSKAILFSFFSLALACAGETALAWGDLGHQTVAEIAQRNLTPQAKKAVEKILGPEP